MPTPNDRGPHRPRTNIQYHVENGWVVPDQPQTPPRRTSTQEQRRAAARRARAKRRRLRQLALIGTACGILVVSGVITALLPAKGADAPLTSDAPANTRLVAPVPYAGSNGSTGTAQALNWGTVGPQRQSADTGYTYTALPAAPAALPEFGRVDTSWFADAAFLGDSLTAGFCVNEYNIDVGGALVCGYEGISPNTIVNRATVTSPDRLAVINAAIQQLCAERGCYYLDLSAEFADDAGYLSTEFSQPDGVHLTVSGYSRWVSYLCTHVPYSKDNPYQAGSTYYLSEDMKGLLSDLP